MGVQGAWLPGRAQRDRAEKSLTPDPSPVRGRGERLQERQERQ